MVVHLEITDRAGARSFALDRDSFWIGTQKSGCEVEIDLPGAFGRVLEVRITPPNRLLIRAEPGLPFPIRSVSGNIGARFESLLDGDVLNVGPALLKLRSVQALESGARAETLDPSKLAEGPGTPIGTWYQTFMEFADHLEGLSTPERMVVSAMEAILAATSADRVYLQLETERGESKPYFLAQGGDRTPFRISQTLVEQVREQGRVVHVPVASADPVASQFSSVRREGISSSIALPIKALGNALGVLYADCVRGGAVLTASDLQRVAFIGRLLASALGNQSLVHNLVRAEPAMDMAVHPALQTSSPACAEMIERVKLYAPTDYGILLRGETGTGKEVLARAIHDLSRRKKGPFVPVNCAAIPEQLMESMLFGHEKGSFTGAAQAHAGHFEEAHGGTIFLDEIGDMALDLQAKILRVLQDRIVTPIGSRKSAKVDVRVLAATHQDLERMVAEGRFREDLYFRLRELEIVLPRLRDRSEDLLMLSNRFLAEAARELGLAKVPELAAETLAFLQRHPFRGNIRELRHLLKGAALRAGGASIQVAHLDLAPAGRADAAGSFAADVDPRLPWKDRLDAQERAALQETLQRANGNLTKGAELFGVPRTTYREKLVKAGLLKAE